MTHRGIKEKGKALRTYRLEMSVDREQKDLFARAAALEGRSLSAFIMNSAREAALKTIQDHEMLVLTGSNQDIFIRALLNPPKPTQEMRQAALRYRKDLSR